MDSIYKQGLCAKLDNVSKLERNGYGLVHEKKESEVLRAIAFTLFMVALVGAYVVLNV